MQLNWKCDMLSKGFIIWNQQIHYDLTKFEALALWQETNKNLYIWVVVKSQSCVKRDQKPKCW